MLEARDEQGGCRLFAFGLGLEPLLADLTVLVEQDGELQLGGVVRKTVDVDLPDNALRKAALDGTEVLFKRRTMTSSSRVRPSLPLTGTPRMKSLRVEDFEESGETIRVSVVGCR